MNGEGEGTTQPEEGQGGESQGFVESYLERNVPEDYRTHVEPYLRDVEKNTNERFREHADYRKQWEPYEELGLTEYDPESLQNLIQFAQMAADEDQFKEWVSSAAREMGLIDADEDIDDLEDEDESDLEALLEQKLEERLKPLTERERQREEQERINAASEQIDEEINTLKEQYGEFDEQIVYRFALPYDGPDAIQQGFKDYQEWLSKTENGVLEGKDSTPPPPEGHGRADTTAKPITEFSEAKRLARERIHQANSQ